MNPLTNVKNINKLNEIELAKGYVNKKSWHDDYKESAWIFIGGLAYGLTEGDILAVFSQYGEIVNVNLVRDKKTGKTKGYCFLCYANQKSTVLAVDNLNGIKLCSRTIRVDHVANYKPPKDNEQDDDITKLLKTEGCAPKRIKLEPQSDDNDINNEELKVKKVKKKKVKKEKKKHKKSKKSENHEKKHKRVKVKKEKHDPDYDKYEHVSIHKETSKRSKESASSSDDEPSSTESDSPSENARKRNRNNYEGNSKHSRITDSGSTASYDTHHPSTSFDNSARQNETFVSQTSKTEKFKENIAIIKHKSDHDKHETKRRRHDSSGEEDSSFFHHSPQRSPSNDFKHYSKSDQSHRLSDRFPNTSEDRYRKDSSRDYSKHSHSYSQEKSLHARENHEEHHRKSSYREHHKQSDSYYRKRSHSRETQQEQRSRYSYKDDNTHTETYSREKRSHSKDNHKEQYRNSDFRDHCRREK